ncbi:MAG: hypothetical protein IKM39_02445, partial [Clostridia bacterium]|nr:hypothetical protein [Clostridia bacterium]
TVANAQAQRNYVYQDIPFLSLPINNSDTSNVVYDGYGYPMDKIFSLPIDAVNDIASFGYSSNFDVYMDSYGGVYWFYEGTNILHSYEPFTENIKLGETIVNQEDALSLAYDFVDIVGYDVSDYSIRTSNQYSKNYTIQFYLEDDATEKLVFHMQSDDQGYVYINSFTAYNYNR